MKSCASALLIFFVFTVPGFATVAVSKPLNGATVIPTVQFIASASSSTCSGGVAAIGIYIDNVKEYTVNGSSLNTTLSLSPGIHHAVVQEWDYCGGASGTQVTIDVVNQTGVSVTSPANNSTVGSPVNFVATAGTSTCSQGVASMGVYVDNDLEYVGNGSTLNTSISITPGTHHATVQEWDYCGGASGTPVTMNVTSKTGVFLTSPANNSTVGPLVTFAATASTNSCPQGISAMGIYVNSELVYTVNGAQLNTQLTLGSGPQYTTVKAWDYCGGAYDATANLTVVNTSNAKQLSNLQSATGWDAWGEYPPIYAICTAPCPGITWSMDQHQTSPSLSGSSTRFLIGGTTPYSDVLWSNKLMGQGSTQNLADTGRTLIPNLHNFVLDADVDVTNATVTQALEFDVNMYLDGVGMEWGTECNHLNDGDWDIWDNVNAHWVSTGVACPVTNGWHHLTLQVQRESNNDLLYQSITWDGVTHNINQTYAPFEIPSGWYGLTMNYQMDGNYNQSQNITYLDNVNLKYW